MSIVNEIYDLKIKRNAVILVHNYQPSEIHDIADFVGDSLGLSIQASETDKDVILFCGVYFMAETAKILSPQKTVLIPDKNAGCPMADMITRDQLRSLKEKHPGAKVLCYVNTTADVKAECDYCCTSANAISIANKAFKDEDEIIFAPDKYLAHYVASKTGRKFIPWHGFCPTHIKILPQNILKHKEQHPEARVLVHRECTPDVIKLADEILSTEGMCKYAKNSHDKEFIIGTEIGMLYRLRKENPEKSFFPASELAICPNMKLTTLEKVKRALEEMDHEIIIDPDIISRANNSIQKMLNFKD